MCNSLFLSELQLRPPGQELVADAAEGGFIGGAGGVGDADDVAVGDGVALGVLGILDGGGDLAGLDVGERLGHGLDVILEGCLAVHAEHGGEGLRHGLGGHDARRDVGQLAGGRCGGRNVQRSYRPQ